MTISKDMIIKDGGELYAQTPDGRIELFSRKCSVTGKGFIDGFLCGEQYAKNQADANQLAINAGYDHFSQAYYENGDDWYYSEWFAGFDYSDGETEFYTEEGEEVEII